LTARHPRFPLVDSVRALAALSVFAYHVGFHFDVAQQGALAPYSRQLNIGVAIFFVISGFVLYRPFAGARHRGDPPPELVPYAVRRALRIVPAYWVALPIAALMLGLSDVFTPRGIVTYFGFLQIYDTQTIVGGIGPAWTLCVEVSFYAALPLWALLLRRVRGDFLLTELGMLAALAAGSLAWKAAFLYLVPPDTPGWLPAQIWLPAFADHFAIGMALAVCSVAAPAWLRRLDSPTWLPWLAAAGGFVLLSAGTEPGVSYDGGALWQHELRGVIGALLLLPAVATLTGEGVARRVLGRPALLWLGLVSYGFYLWHWPIIRALEDEGAGVALLTLAALGLTVAAAAASWYVIERPAQRFGRTRFGRIGARAEEGGEPADVARPASRV
jgi:peptidoglycan/LPS O-acetylase OafA/YrhL